MNCPLRRLTAGLLVLSIATTTQAEIIGYSLPTDRERIAAHLDREGVGAELVRHGIAPENAKARVAALTDAEAAALAGRMDSAPAGGGDPISLVVAAIGFLAFGVALAVVGIVKGVEHLAKAVAKGPTAPAPVPTAAE
jgi:glutathione S-transferase